MAIPEAAPARLGRYELVARLATGGMGEIFLARLEGAAGFEKLFVIKRILPHLADDARFRGMLIAEARIASVMAHANICQVYELGETSGQLYIVMEYLEGITALPLLHRMSKQRRPLELGLVAGVIQQAIDGLHYAHELKDRGGEYLGIVHRDVTPSNIFLTDAGIVKILDFGIAKVKDASLRTETGAVKGKYAYMAPEQLRGHAIDRRADVFALGIVLFEMLALRRLFQRKTDYLTFRAVMEQPIPDVRRYRPDCPPPLALAVARALDRDPANRFASARQLGSAVQDAVTPGHRAWSQGEIGDYIAANFADDIQKRGAQIARVIGAGGPPPALPALIDPADPELDDETDNEFPPVDSTLTDAPVPTPSGEHFAVIRDDEPSARTGPATKVDKPVGTGRFPARPPAGESAVVPAPPRRSVVWPLLAFAMAAVAAGALVLVSRQTQTTTITINSGSDHQIGKDGPNTLVIAPKRIDPVAPVPADDRAGAATNPPPEPAPARTSPPARAGARPAADAPVDERYAGVVKQRSAEVAGCGASHGNPPPGSKLVIEIAASGHPRRVAVVPETPEVGPLAACLEQVFSTAQFPRGKREITLTSPLTLSGRAVP